MNFRFELNDGTVVMVYDVKASEVIEVPNGAVGVSVFFAVSAPTIVSVGSNGDVYPLKKS